MRPLPSFKLATARSMIPAAYGVVLRDNARMSLAWRSLLVLPVAVACGTGATSSDDGDGSSDAGATTTVGSTSMTGGNSTVASGDSTAASDDPSECPAFADETSPGPVTIEIINMRAEGVWLPMSPDCIDPVPWLLQASANAVVPWRPPACGTCTGAVQGQCPCPPPFCDQVTALYLEAGATIRYEWSGLVYLEEVVPDACPGIDECGATCQRAVVAPQDYYAFTILAGGATGCAVEPCGCMPVDGSCTLLDPGMRFMMLTGIEESVGWPNESMVQLVIE